MKNQAILHGRLQYVGLELQGYADELLEAGVVEVVEVESAGNTDFQEIAYERFVAYFEAVV